MWQTFSIEPLTAAINYGLDRVRFINPVVVGSRIRDAVVLDRVTEAGGGLQLALTQTVEIAGVTKPACVAETVIRVFL
jgi:acyl dehydratase